MAKKATQIRLSKATHSIKNEQPRFYNWVKKDEETTTLPGRERRGGELGQGRPEEPFSQVGSVLEVKVTIKNLLNGVCLLAKSP
jgi:hypothetical protein